MALVNLRRKLQHSSAFKKLADKLGPYSPLNFELIGVGESNTVFLADHIVRHLNRNVLWVAPEKDLQRYRELKNLLGKEQTLYFPEWDIDPYEHRLPDWEIVSLRIKSLLDLKGKYTKAIVTSPRALFNFTISPETLFGLTRKISVGDEIDPEKLAKHLSSMGYEREDLVEFLGSFSRRGDVLDIFGPCYFDPVRIEFFGDKIESIRTFSAENQRSKEKLTRVIIPPAVEWVKDYWGFPELDEEILRSEIKHGFKSRFRGKKGDELLGKILAQKHFPGEIWMSPALKPGVGYLEQYLPLNTTVILEEPEEIDSVGEDFLARADEHHRELERDREPHIVPEDIFKVPDRINKKFAEKQVLSLRQYPTRKKYFDMGFRSISRSYDGPVAFRKVLDSLRERDFETVILCRNHYQLTQLLDILPEEERVPAYVEEIGEGFENIFAKVAVISGDSIFGRKRGIAPRRKYHQGSAYALPTGLVPGDPVVHTDHGVGIFMGIETLETGGVTSECLVLKYSGEQKLYVPIEDFHLVQKYLGGSNVKLAKLGGVAWAKAKKRAHKSVMSLAGELVHLYALREVKEGFAFPEEDDLSIALKDSFPYRETQDQIKAIDEVLSDMESDKPMDRLLVGDVGFGKTEVSIRAAFKAIRGGKQVAILVPTTVLADQHYRTFSERLKELPVRVEMLSGFVEKKDQKKIVKDLANGQVDVIIGTHRLLSRDISFKNLGLLVIDEEQRFGVKQKERIKRWRAQVDVLAMTATPIPRTLYLSLATVRDMSTINTPPENRLPIYTRVIPFKENIIAEIIEREIERGGQVYFLHNRVGSIEAMAHWLRELVPNARFAVAHGQMKDRELAEIIGDFLAEKFDVLVTTTIIETGTDIPNVNTILINRADRFGVAQLYQLRGRVGRSDAQAYCYLISPPYKNMTKKAKKRFRALLEHSDLGSGFALAMRDLEIRGAGNLLGSEQHGFIEEIGLDLYTKMLSESVAELKGQKPPHFDPVNTQIDAPLYIPKEYIPSVRMRIEFYQKLFMASNSDQLNRLKSEIKDRFGSPPDEVQTLFMFLRMRLVASQIKIPLMEVILKKGLATFLFQRDWNPRLSQIDRAISSLDLKADFRRNPFELRFKLTGETGNDLVVMKDIAHRLAQIEPDSKK